LEKYVAPDIKAWDATSLAAARLAVQFVLTFTPDEAHNNSFAPDVPLALG
jgi:hypothetical protein